MSILALTACGSKDDENKSKKYSLAFNDLGEHWAYIEWDGEQYISNSLYLKFDEGVPEGAEWYLE